MPSPDFDDADAPLVGHRRSGLGRLGSVVVVGVLVVLVCGAAALAWRAWTAAVGRDEAAHRAATDRALAEGAERRAAAVRARGVWERRDFTAAVTGRTGADVRAIVGAPHVVADFGPRPFWQFKGLTRDPATGEPDAETTVVFAGGVVVEVRFGADAGDK